MGTCPPRDLRPCLFRQDGAFEFVNTMIYEEENRERNTLLLLSSVFRVFIVTDSLSWFPENHPIHMCQPLFWLPRENLSWLCYDTS